MRNLVLKHIVHRVPSSKQLIFCFAVLLFVVPVPSVHAVRKYQHNCKSRCFNKYFYSKSKRKKCRRICHRLRDKILRDLAKRVKLNPRQRKQVEAIIKEVNKRWLNTHGFIRLHPHNGKNKGIDNENPVLFTATYFYMLKRLGMLKGPDVNRLLPKIRAMLNKLRLEPGLFNRYPSPGKTKRAHTRHFSRDEQIGLAMFDISFDKKLGLFKELYTYGEKNSYFYENRTWISTGKHRSKPGVRRLDGFRQHNFRGFIRMGVGKSMSLVHRKWTIAALHITGGRNKGKTSGKILAYLRFEVLRHGPEDVKDAIVKFHLKMQRMYGIIPFQGLFKIYYQNPRHPIRRLASYLR